VRVVALLVVVCGCRVGTLSAVDATTPRGDGLAERVTTEAPLWADVRLVDAAAGDRPDDRTQSDRDGSANDMPADGIDPGPDSTVDVACDLFANTCPKQRGCYTDEVFSGKTLCLPSPAGLMLDQFPCQLQNDCAPGEACIDVKGTGQICLQLCHTDLPFGDCLNLNATACVPIRHYPGVGTCF
jgi:hypothetical protein